MVGHFLNPGNNGRRMNRSSNSGRASAPSAPVATDFASSAASSSVLSQPPRPLMPQDLTAEAVAALPPPGKLMMKGVIFHPKF